MNRVAGILLRHDRQLSTVESLTLPNVAQNKPSVAIHRRRFPLNNGYGDAMFVSLYLQWNVNFSAKRNGTKWLNSFKFLRFERHA
jgi:hypothetical protein